MAEGVRERSTGNFCRPSPSSVSLLHYLVIAPVKRVSAMADAVSLGEENVETYVRAGKDEIASLSRSFNRMRESLKHAMAMMT